MRSLLRMVLVVGLICGLVGACSTNPTDEELAAVDFAPGPVDGWPVSTPQERGMDPDAVAELYWRAEQLGPV